MDLFEWDKKKEDMTYTVDTWLNLRIPIELNARKTIMCR
jgi:hypothetical protein